MIDMDKKYQTKNGLPVELYKKHDCGMFPIIGAYFEHNAWRPSCWCNDGGNKENPRLNLESLPNFKLLRYIEHYQESCNYFSMNIRVPAGVNWLATDFHGILCGYANEPILTFRRVDDKQGYWCGGNDFVKLARVDFIGDWHQSKLKVKND